MTTLLLTAKCNGCGGDATNLDGGLCPICFLRSDNIPRRQVRRSPIKSAEVHNSTQLSERRPPTAIDRAIERRPPRAAERRRAATRAANEAARSRGDYASAYRNSDHIDTLRRVECRVIGWLVTKALGDAWSFERAAERHETHRIAHQETGAAMTFRELWSDASRYQIAPENVHRSDALPGSITVSGDRSPASIARDIERRLIDAGLLGENAKLAASGTERRRKEVSERLQCLAVARAYGGRLREERHWRSQGRPAATCEHFGPHTEERGGNGRETDISASIEYFGIQLEINTSSTELAIKIAELVRNHYQGVEQ